jgi:NAD(P)-dependent dehydrogenase (short-subunit alcohol dehydrogenase family)
MKTVLITGCSSGFGLETAKYFLDRDWNVIATMRTPREDVLPSSDRLRILALDVAKPESIRSAVEAAGPIDVLVNNAGIGLMGIFEGTSIERTREVFETNTFGTLMMTQEVLPQFRQRRSGVIVNVSSGTTLSPHPMLASYTASKAAINAFSQSLAIELEQFNIRVKVVIPGRSPETTFSKNAQPRMQGAIPEAYAEFAQGLFTAMGQSSGPVTHAKDVAEAIWRAATDPACPALLPAGADAVALFEAR